MSSHACIEDQFVERSAIGLFAAIGSQSVSAMEETFGAVGTLGRETKGEVVLTERRRVVDWERPEQNDFLLVSQVIVVGSLYTCRPDLVGFVNGLPWVVIELKSPGVPARSAFDENLTHYKQQIPQLFWFNALLIASNGTDSRVGSLNDRGRCFEWNRSGREDEPRYVSLEVMVRRTRKFSRPRLLSGQIDVEAIPS
jgi:type I restriction enzyme R subunit